MEAPHIIRIGGERAPPPHQRHSAEPGALWAKPQGRRKYLFTDQIDQLIREIYLSHPGAKTRPGIRMLAKKVGISHWAHKKRARELGLARYAWMSDERIRLKLKAAGYSRTVTGIYLKLRRMKFKHDPGFYSANGLAQALGIDSHAVSRWTRFASGHSGAARRAGNQQNGDIYLIPAKFTVTEKT